MRLHLLAEETPIPAFRSEFGTLLPECQKGSVPLERRLSCDLPREPRDAEGCTGVERGAEVCAELDLGFGFSSLALEFDPRRKDDELLGLPETSHLHGIAQAYLSILKAPTRRDG